MSRSLNILLLKCTSKSAFLLTFIMFYSQDVLRSREHGVATIWLVATLGSHSSLGRLGRKDILRVDVTKACKTIATPAAPLALRLQSNLLYGISRVFAEQCSYVLSDVQSATNGIRLMTRASATTLPDSRKSGSLRSEHLLLADDPYFDLSNDTSLLQIQELARDSGRQSDPLRRHSIQRIIPLLDDQPHVIIESSPLDDARLFGSLVNSSTTPEGFNIRSSLSARFNPKYFNHSNEENLLGDADFAVDADGNVTGLNDGDGIIFRSEANHLGADDFTNAENLMRGRNHDSNDLALEASHQSWDNAFFGSSGVNSDHQLATNVASFGSQAPQHDNEDFAFEPGVASYGAADMSRKERPKKRLDIDHGPLELRNSRVAAWNQNYLANMIQIKLTSHRTRHDNSAKRNASHLVWLFGPGGSGATACFRSYGNSSDPLCAFHGSGFQAWIWKGRKRPHSEDDLASDQVGKRVKQHDMASNATLNKSIGNLNDDALGALEFDNDIEIGRGLPNLEPSGFQQEYETSSIMPWNTGSSRASSIWNRLKPRSHSSATPSARERQSYYRSDRTFSVSPLPGLDSYEMLAEPSYLPSESHLLNSSEAPDSNNNQALVRPGTQPLAEQKLYDDSTLDGEYDNFMTFVLEAINTRTKLTKDARKSISFQELFPPESTTSAVAAQALLIALSLSVEGLLYLKQTEHFATIGLTPTSSYGAHQE